MRKPVAAFLLLASVIRWTAASAAEIKVLTAGAFKTVVMAVMPDFEKQSGNQVIVDRQVLADLQAAMSNANADRSVIDRCGGDPPRVWVPE